MTTPPQPPRADDDPQPPLQDDAATLLAIPGSRRGSGSTPFAPGGGGHHTTRALAESFPFQRGEHLGSGGIGEVYSARDRRLSREVAIKTLQRNHTAEARARFLREARITARLEHPNIVPVHELMEDPDGNLSLVMKVVRGLTLEKWCRAEARATSDLIDVFARICDAVSFAHSHGIIHRDLKPQNVMIGAFGEVQVMDWGLARDMHETEATSAPAGSLAAAPGDADTTRTLDGSVIGTPAWMAPEQARGDIDQLDERSDVYSLGATLYYMLAGVPPFDGATLFVLQKVRNGEFAPPSSRAVDGRHVPPQLDSLVMRAMALDPADRPQSVAELMRMARQAPAWDEVQAELNWKAPVRDPNLLVIVSLLSTFRLMEPNAQVLMASHGIDPTCATAIRTVVGAGATGCTMVELNDRMLRRATDLPATLRLAEEGGFLVPGPTRADGSQTWVSTDRGRWLVKISMALDQYLLGRMPKLPESELLQLSMLLARFRRAMEQSQLQPHELLTEAKRLMAAIPDPGPSPAGAAQES